MTIDRLQNRFDLLKKNGRGGFVSFVTAGDPDFDTSLNIVKSLPQAGADIVELGMPFSDPMADGPIIQASSQRALASGMNLRHTLKLVEGFRQDDSETPIVLMGYFNPIYQYGSNRFIEDALSVGVDGLIIVDLPPEEDDELCHPARISGLDWIRLITPTTDSNRMQLVLNNSSGFVYYVSITGITGTQSISASAISDSIAQLRNATKLPIAVGFGISTAEQVSAVIKNADAAVVGSILIREIEKALNINPISKSVLVDGVLNRAHELSQGIFL